MLKLLGPSRADSTSRARSVPKPSRSEKKLSLERCRALLGPGPALSDAELERLRDDLILVASVINDGFVKSRNGGVAPGVSTPQTDVDAQERAAIMEYDGKMSRTEAERASGLLPYAPERTRTRFP